MADAITLAIVDDHPIFRRGLRAVLDEPGAPMVQIVGEAATAAQALAIVEEHAPDVLIADLQLGTFEAGLALIRQVVALSPRTRVLVITGFDTGPILLSAIQAGARGCIAKADQLDSTTIRNGIARVAAGEIFNSDTAMRRLYGLLERRVVAEETIIGPLTRREREVLRLIADGLSNRAIAERLVIAERTVKTHVENILGKLQVPTRELAALYIHTIDPDLS